MTKKELAIANHDKKFNCAQAVACAFAKEVGVDEKTLFQATRALDLAWAERKLPAARFRVP